jgi:hypothetical protein
MQHSAAVQFAAAHILLLEARTWLLVQLYAAPHTALGMQQSLARHVEPEQTVLEAAATSVAAMQL